MRLRASLLAMLLAVVSLAPEVRASDVADDSLARPEDFLLLLTPESAKRRAAKKRIESTWQPGYAVMALEILYFSRDPETRQFLVSTLQKKTGQKLGDDTKAWYEWIWDQPAQDHPRYAEFKGLLYRLIDPRFEAYFDDARPKTIRLDEVRWGGVRQDGIPPLRSPKMIAAAEADYLDDDNVVFGLSVNGDARAYPKRILAWHEMFTDTVGDVPVTGVYCTLCGTVILYDSEVDGVVHELGTGGFLYRSNKLMYDQATQSLWSTIWGTPVIGPLVGQSIQLVHRGVVTTTWGEWRRRHPETLVLSLDTGHQRDYSEGAAYREYFATDELMFNVPELDDRLDNKAEVLVFVDRAADEQLAISADFLAQKPVYHDRIGGTEMVVLTDSSGANRAYSSGGRRFADWDQDRLVTDEDGGSWELDEHRLVGSDGTVLPRVPAQRAFWFGWYASYPETRLVK